MIMIIYGDADKAANGIQMTGKPIWVYGGRTFGGDAFSLEAFTEGENRKFKIQDLTPLLQIGQIVKSRPLL